MSRLRKKLMLIAHRDSVESLQLKVYPYREPDQRDPWYGDVLAGRSPLIELVMKYCKAADIEAAQRSRKPRPQRATAESLRLLQRKINDKFGH